MAFAPAPLNSIPPRRYSLKTRLYAVIGLLALLPLLGVVVTMISQQRMQSEDATFKATADGAIRLERINGLLYAATMESRGIYMSPTWAAAKPFADGLIDDLAELQRQIPLWQHDAAAMQEQNIEELTRRIENFIGFRTELVRLAREESMPAARAFGDNEANRNIRKSLNQSMEALAHSYQHELDLAELKVEAGDRAFIGRLATLAAVAGIVLCGGFLLVRNSLVRPLLALKDRMLQLAAGQLDGPIDQMPRAEEISEMVQAVASFRDALIDHRRLAREMGLLSSLNEWLQSCNSLNELYEMTGLVLPKLLPQCSGNLFIYANSRDILESAQAWNGTLANLSMRPEDCWGLRRGHTYTYGAAEIDFPCGHVAAGAKDPYCCIPIVAHGDTIGLLHVNFPPGAGIADPVVTEERRLAIACAEQISLAVANVKLRDQLRDQAIRDPLTGLFNRRYLMETARREFARASRSGNHVGILSIDIDHFKKYNDNHGHDAGDAVLRAVGGCLDTLFRIDDVPSRFGGEEFVVILPGADIATALRRGEQLRGRIEALAVHYLDQDLPRISVSIGVATFPEAGDAPAGVMRAADEALYRAKSNGRNRVESAAMPENARQAANEVAALPPPVLADAADG